MSADRLRRISFVLLSAMVRADGFLTGYWFSPSGFVILINIGARLTVFKVRHKHKCRTLPAISMTLYPTTYTDKFGSENSSFISDGMSLRIQLRNQFFVGVNFDSLEIELTEQTINGNFSFNEYNSLTDCSFKIMFPIRLKRNHELLDGALNVEVNLENSKHPVTKSFQLTIYNDTFDIQNGAENGMWFESQMIQLQRLLPKDLKIHSCIFCAYSNYWIAGSDSFGTLLCFKDIKDKIVGVKNKSDYIALADKNGISTQETFLCPVFKEIAKDQWQYKDPM